MLLREAPFKNVLFPYGKRGGGGVKSCQDGLGHFFPTFARGSKHGLARMVWGTFFHVCPFARGGGFSIAHIERTYFKKGLP